ncbi:MAG: mechanosensitive ion channel family protein [Saprospiraceae bacterium]|uniref:Mechanosensitive ion channel family protein n=1 Tax=Candidatus Opimibacter skivensis TaxID=2982028 RepID=A0A9D7XPK0_9BACT|nr:mechanosensitive ion channel family protein [Candidatus Opimibacter skivensis]
MRESIQAFMYELSPWLLSHGVKILFYLIGAYLLRAIARRFIARVIRISVKQDERNPTAQDEKMREDTLIRVCVLVINFALLGLFVMMSLQEMGIPIGPMLAGAGIFGIALGFGGQYLVRDIISGFFIIFENQYRIGDVVNFDGTSGKVEDIGLRITTLRDMDGTVHHVPHGEVKKVANFSKSFARVNLDIPIVYASNLDHVIETVNRVGMELAEDLTWKDLIIKAPQFLRVDDFTDTAILVKIVGETQSLKQWQVTGELRKRIKEAFDREGIEMPVHDRQIRKSEPPAPIT